MGVSNGPVAWAWAAEHRNFRSAVIVHFLDTPIPGVLTIPEQLGAEIVSTWAAHCSISSHTPDTRLTAPFAELSDDESTALARLLRKAIDDDRYPLSPRIRTLQGILDQIVPPPVRETPPPLRVYEPPRAKPGQRRGRR
jgi:hypothetical protein